MGNLLYKNIGYRKPGTEPGTWTGAIVARTFCGIPTCMGLFEDGKDFVGKPSAEELQKVVEKYKAQGWLPMTQEDIARTAGI